MAPVVTMRQLLDAGVHFGHQTRRWNPKMKRFIHGERNGIYIIDLQQTLGRIETSYSYVRDLVADGGTILFVGTKKQAQDPVRSYAESCGMPYVNERWLGGMLTNFQTMSKRVAKMKEYQRMRDSGEFEAMPKKEALLISRELEKLERNLGGIRNMERDPDIIQYVIPGNDDAISSDNLMCRVIADAVTEGRFIASRKRGAVAPEGPAVVERTPEEIAEHEAAQAEARRQAAEAAAARDARIAAERAAADEAASAAEETVEVVDAVEAVGAAAETTTEEA